MFCQRTVSCAKEIVSSGNIIEFPITMGKKSNRCPMSYISMLNISLQPVGIAECMVSVSRVKLPPAVDSWAREMLSRLLN